LFHVYSSRLKDCVNTITTTGKWIEKQANCRIVLAFLVVAINLKFIHVAAAKVNNFKK